MTILNKYPQLLQIGSTGRNSGKTFFAKDIISKLKDDYPIVALKIITIRGARGVCQRGGRGCGICTSIDAGYELTEETDCSGLKDTMQLLNAGCQRSFMLKAFEDSLLAGFEAFWQTIQPGTLVVCESNSLRKYLIPGLFVMIHNQRKTMKKSADEVAHLADYTIDAKKVLETSLSLAVEMKESRPVWIEKKKWR